MQSRKHPFRFSGGEEIPTIFFLYIWETWIVAFQTAELVECLSEYVVQENLEGFGVVLFFNQLFQKNREAFQDQAGLFMLENARMENEMTYGMQFMCEVDSFGVSKLPCLTSRASLIATKPLQDLGVLLELFSFPEPIFVPDLSVPALLVGTAVVLVLGTVLVFTRHSMSRTCETIGAMTEPLGKDAWFAL